MLLVYVTAYMYKRGSCLTRLHHALLLTSSLKLETAVRTMIPQGSNQSTQVLQSYDATYVGIRLNFHIGMRR